MLTIKGPAIPVAQPGSYKFFDIYNTTNRLTYHSVDQESHAFYNAPIATFTPHLPERGYMYDTAVFSKPTSDRLSRLFIRNVLQKDGETEATEKFSTPRRQFFETLIPRHKYLDDWNIRDLRRLKKMYVSEYNYNIGDKWPDAKNLPSEASLSSVPSVRCTRGTEFKQRRVR